MLEYIIISSLNIQFLKSKWFNKHEIQNLIEYQKYIPSKLCLQHNIRDYLYPITRVEISEVIYLYLVTWVRILEPLLF